MQTPAFKAATGKPLPLVAARFQVQSRDWKEWLGWLCPAAPVLALIVRIVLPAFGESAQLRTHSVKPRIAFEDVSRSHHTRVPLRRQGLVEFLAELLFQHRVFRLLREVVEAGRVGSDVVQLLGRVGVDGCPQQFRHARFVPVLDEVGLRRTVVDVVVPLRIAGRQPGRGEVSDVQMSAGAKRTGRVAQVVEACV